MKVRPACVALLLGCLLGPARLSADEITSWNNVMLDAIRVDSMNAMRATRLMAMTHTAMYDAVNSIDDTHILVSRESFSRGKYRFATCAGRGFLAPAQDSVSH